MISRPLFLALLCAVWTVPAHCAIGPASPFQIGMNLDGVSDYSAQSPFVDAMKQSRPWGSPQSPWDQAAQVDANGWPTQDAGAVVLCCIGDAKGHSLISGDYALSFTGQAVVGLVVGGSVGGQSYDAATNTTTATVSIPDNGTGTLIGLSFTNTQRLPTDRPGTGVTNVRMIRPQMAPNGHPWWGKPTQIFTDPFLALLRPFAALRSMGFENTNGSPVVNWSDRTTPSYATQQTPAGVAWEYVIELANDLDKDMWINIPDQATSAYVASLAKLMKARLKPSLHLYLEYSNEVWNYSFPQAGRNQAAAEAEVAANPNSPLAWQCADYDSCRYQWGERRVGEQIVLIAQEFQKVFGTQATMLRPIYATQLGQTYFVSLVLPMIQQFWGAPSSLLYGIAQAPYWSGDNTLKHLNAAAELSNAAANLAGLSGSEQGFATWARYYGLQSVTYEGGPGMSGTASLSGKLVANRAPAMGAQVTQAIDGAASEGVSLYMYFNDAGIYGQYGMWGATENVFDVQTPKLKALHDLIASGSAPLQGGILLPANFASTAPDLSFGSEYIVNGNTYAYLGQGGLFGYLVDVPAAGSYSVTLTVGTYYGATTAALALDQAPIGTATVPDTGGSVSNWTQTAPVTVTLPAGLHVLSVSAPSGQFGLQTIGVQ